MENYSYPLDETWNKQELVQVIDFLNFVEQANETGVKTEAFLNRYEKFKKVVKSIGEEKRIGREFEQASGYSIYKTVQMAKNTTNASFKL